ncbi:hypothetical protein B4U79_13821 [Dinothrombium tinctorium]|uniref:Uncharacterized protein n=1 Tax=Dinothrombium tinctorium TaxID=1965070 RepID=A0A443R0C6_9ACAR|nr:hypothetical protein B4U79_13821 [Dinothrombium tinctorium]
MSSRRAMRKRFDLHLWQMQEASETWSQRSALRKRRRVQQASLLCATAWRKSLQAKTTTRTTMLRTARRLELQSQ